MRMLELETQRLTGDPLGRGQRQELAGLTQQYGSDPRFTDIMENLDELDNSAYTHREDIVFQDGILELHAQRTADGSDVHLLQTLWAKAHLPTIGQTAPPPGSVMTHDDVGRAAGTAGRRQHHAAGARRPRDRGPDGG